MKSTCTLLSLLLLLCSLHLVCAGRIHFDSRELLDKETLRIKVGLVTEDDAWIGGSNDTTTLEIDQSFIQETVSEGQIEVLVYYSARAEDIGYEDEEGIILYCCSMELMEEGVCGNLGEVIVRNNDEHILRYPIRFDGESDTQNLHVKYASFGVSGIYYIKYFNCPGEAGTVVIGGDVSWMNPFGHLSADLYPFLWFFGVMTVAYIILGFFWIIFSACHWSQLLMLQYCIAGVIFLGMIECITWYFDFLSYNMSGHFNWGAIIIGVLSSTLKRTVSRLLVLVVSLGYGVVKANLGTNTYKVLFLGMLYFAVSGLQQLILTYLREGDSQFLSFLATIIIFPAALLDTVFYWWIFLALMRTIQQLKLRKQEVKLAMYKKFFVVLAVSGVLTTLVIIYQTLLVITSSEDAMWRTWWMFTAFWHVLYFTILVAISVLWRPTTNNTRYAYRESEDLEIELVNISGKRKNDDIEIGEEINLDFDISGILEADDNLIDEVGKME